MKQKFEQPKRERPEEYSGEYKKELLELYSELFPLMKEEGLNGKETFEELMDNGKIMRARIRLLKALDEAVMSGLVSDRYAKERYQTLGFEPDEASRIRQSQIGIEDYHISER